ncbi:MAG: hypothetical protein KAH95_09390 [Spirochaetales bacterium]|nr:hypothetical protein [Spirochaetales bacterium]
MNKKFLPLFLLILILGSAMIASAQSLQDNPDYLKSVELKKQSESAFASGDFLEAKRLAEESQVYAALSDKWIVMMLNRYRANSALKRVETQLMFAAGVNAEIHFPASLATGKTLYDEARQLFQEEEYLPSFDKSQEALEVMSVIEYIKPAAGVLAASYVVRELPGNTDCLWNIAGYEFIYGDPWKWKLIYEANMEIMPEPGNPSLIIPGMILIIPSAPGEERSGTWENGKIR